jgi:hypothetical protein
MIIDIEPNYLFTVIMSRKNIINSIIIFKYDILSGDQENRFPGSGIGQSEGDIERVERNRAKRQKVDFVNGRPQNSKKEIVREEGKLLPSQC